MIIIIRPEQPGDELFTRQINIAVFEQEAEADIVDY
jgi:predicted N-acetyltransferase YhbS